MSSRADHSCSEAERLPPGPNGWITFLYYFGLTSLILSVVIAQLLHLDLGTPTPYQYALILGLIGGAWGSYFHRSVTLELTSNQPQKLLADVEKQLHELGFTQCHQQGDIRTYSPGFLPSLFMGNIRVLIQSSQIQIAGRAIQVRELQRAIAPNTQ
jgi:hypothetical protein